MTPTVLSRRIAAVTAIASLVCLSTPVASASAAGSSKFDDFEGVWIEGEAKMLVGQEHGLLVIFGSDPDTTYRLHCVVGDKNKVATCQGHGLVNGKQGVLIRSEIRVKDDGGLIEEWKAAILNTSKQGVTNWTRKISGGR